MRPLSVILVSLGITLNASAQIATSWTGNTDQQWHNPFNWSPAEVPDNIGIDTYDATLGSGAGLVFVNAPTTIESLSVAAGVTLSVSNSFIFTVRDDATNNGDIRLEGANNISRFSILDSSGDNRVQIDGGGTIFLDSGNDRIGGALNHTFIQSVDHSIRGHGNLGEGTIRIENAGFVVADTPGEVLTVQPRGSFLNDGFLWASGGGSLDLRAATYTNQTFGELSVSDNSEIRVTNITLNNGTVKAPVGDGSLDDNQLVIAGNSTFFDVTNEAALYVNNGQTLTLSGSSFTNQGIMRPLAASNPTTFSFNGSSDNMITLDGNGSLLLDHPMDRVIGSTDHTLTQAASHEIRGGGTLGGNAINFVNLGAVDADNPSVPLVVDPRANWLNDGSAFGGTLTASADATVQLNPATYTSTDGGRFITGDGGAFELFNATVKDSAFDQQDGDGDPLNHVVRVRASSTFDAVAADTVVRVDNGQTLTITEDLFEHNSELHLDSTGNLTSLLINGGSDTTMELGGTGTLFLDSGNDRIAGTSAHTFVQSAGRRIAGHGSIGSNVIEIINRGLIEADVPGETLAIDPRTTFTNDGGTLAARTGSKVTFASGSYTVDNGGRFLIGDDASFDLLSGTWSDMTFEVDDADADPDNHTIEVNATTTFEDAVNDATLTITNGHTLNLTGGTFTNNGTLRPGGTNNLTTLSINGVGFGNTITIGGTGSVQLDTSLDRIIGQLNHTLINGPSHRIEGSGTLGANIIFIENEGLISANRDGEILDLDDRSGTLTNRGTLQAENGGRLNISDPIADTGGTIAAQTGSVIEVAGSIVQASGTTLVNGTLSATSLTLDQSLLQGTGVVDSPVVATASTVSPGNSTGTLTLAGLTTLGTGSLLNIEVNGAADHDVLQVTGGALQIPDAALQLNYTGSPVGVSATDTLTIVTAGSGTTGAFSNVADGQRLTTADGRASFIVNYLPGAITLTDFIYDPDGAPSQPPVFTSFVETLNLDENTPVNTLLTTFVAEDPESAPIEYALNDPTAPFAIDSVNGELRVSGPVNYEAQTTYNLIVTASDGVEFAQVALTITVNDLIDTNAEIVSDLLTALGGAFPGETDPAIIAYDADPDHDGRINLFELWRGTQPDVPDAATPTLVTLHTVDGADHGSVTVEVDAATDDQLAIDAEFSTDLVEWDPAGLNRDVLSDLDGRRTLRFYAPDPLTAPYQFFVRFWAEADGEPAGD